jgi:hypothetical protein
MGLMVCLVRLVVGSVQFGDEKQKEDASTRSCLYTMNGTMVVIAK